MPVEISTKPINEVWAQLVLSERDSDRIREFFVKECGIKAHRIVPNLHMTVYYARRPLPNLVSIAEAAWVVLPVIESRIHGNGSWRRESKARASTIQA